MKVVWELEDIEFGRLVCKPDCGLTGLHMIGYRYHCRPTAVTSRYGRGGQELGLISLADGLFTNFDSEDDLIQVLNRIPYLPMGMVDLVKAGELAGQLFTGG